jgi:hypothetical protein
VPQPEAAVAVSDAAAGPQRAAGSGAEVLPPEAAAVLDVAAEVLRQVAGAARGAAAEVLPPAAEAVLDVVAEAPRRAVQSVPAARPLAAALAARPLSTRPRGDRPALSPPVRSARGRKDLRIAQP